MIYRLLFQIHIPCFLSITYPQFSLQRTPAILRTNRFICAEAAHVLYTEILIVLLAGHQIGLQQAPYDEYPFSAEIWRHDPFNDPGEVLPNGKCRYRTPELGGDLYPHVFSRFQTIGFIAHTSVHTRQHSHVLSRFSFDLKCVTHIDGDFLQGAKRSAIRHLKDVPVLEQLVKLLSLSYTIRALSIRLDVRIPTLFLDSVRPPRPSAQFVNLLGRLRTIELFIHGGLLDPLRDLTTVENLVLFYDLGDYHLSQELNLSWQSFRSRYVDAEAVKIMRRVEIDVKLGWLRSEARKFASRFMRREALKQGASGDRT